MIDQERAVDTLTRVIDEILNLPEVQKSREILEGGLIVDIVRHALERQYNLGAIEALSEEFWASDNDNDDD